MTSLQEQLLPRGEITVFHRVTGMTAVAAAAVLSLLGSMSSTDAQAAAPSRPAAASPAPSASSGPRLEYRGEWSRVEVGGPVWFGIEGMPAGWDSVTVTSPALRQPVSLTPVEKGAVQSTQVDAPGSQPLIRADIAPGTYPASATSHGHTIATTSLTLVPHGAADIDRFVIEPKGVRPCGDTPTPVRPGSEVVIYFADSRPAPDEDTLTAKSPLFTHPVAIRKKSPDAPGCLRDDASTMYAGHTTVRTDIPAGTYTLTVVSHHGQNTATQQVTVAGEPVTHSRPWLTVSVITAAVLALAAAAGLMVRRRRSASTPT